MKFTIRNVMVSAFVAGILFCCDKDKDEEVFSETPSIDAATLSFVDNPNESGRDTMILALEITDGDFDLGLDAADLNDINPPFNHHNFYVWSGGQLETTEPKIISFEDATAALLESPVQQTLATRNKLRKSGDVRPYDCREFSKERIIINKKFIDNENVIDTLNDDNYVVLDTFLIDRNENYYNIRIEVLVEDNGNFSPYEFADCTTLNGRFFMLSPIKTTGKKGPFNFSRISSAKGKLIYNITENISKIFHGKKIKLRVNINDRHLYRSNTVETEAITIP